jgi:hypothetical protein
MLILYFGYYIMWLRVIKMGGGDRERTGVWFRPVGAVDLESCAGVYCACWPR